MASWSTVKTAQQELVKVRLELEYQKQENARLREKIQELEAAKSKRKSSGTLSLDYTSHSSSSNRRFIRREIEKEEALTTFDFEAFEDFLEEYKDENYQLYFDQDKKKQKNKKTQRLSRNYNYQLLVLSGLFLVA